MREETNLVVLSSSERTMAPSFLLLMSSCNPGKPVTAMILLYSIKTLSFLKAQDTLTGALKKIEPGEDFLEFGRIWTILTTYLELLALNDLAKS